MSVVDADLQRRLDLLRDKHGVPGASLAVLRDDAVRVAASGVLHQGTGVEATTDSLFQIGSIGKVWTATVVLRLVDEGKVELDAPLRRYLPGFAVADEDVSAAVTIRHLLTHTSGIDGDHLVDVGRGNDVLERYAESCAPLRQLHPLGALMSYCNTGYSLLGRVIEVVTDTVWDTAMRERLFAPLGLTHTATLPEDVLRFRAAMGHITLPEVGLVPAPIWSLPRGCGPAGLISSTASNLVEFARMHLADGVARDGTRVLDQATALAMREPRADVPSGGGELFPTRWGLGWSLLSWGGTTLLAHDGGTIGQSSFLRLVPDQGYAVALLTNGGHPIRLFLDLARELLADEAGVEMPPVTTPPADQSPVDPAAFVGVYEREGQRLEVVARDGALAGVMTATGPAAAASPLPMDLPLPVLDLEQELFVTQLPQAPDVWLRAKFLTLADGSRHLHVGGRTSPRAE